MIGTGISVTTSFFVTKEEIKQLKTQNNTQMLSIYSNGLYRQYHNTLKRLAKITNLLDELGCGYNTARDIAELKEISG